MNICIIVGARPNFIKVAPIIRAIGRAHAQGHDIAHQLVYAGRPDDPTLEPRLFDDLAMPRPDAYLGVDCDNLNELTGQVMSAFERYLQAHPTDAVIVVDDLASTMAAAIVTKKQGLLLAHLVAGTRSFDINMPKEINRLVIDGLSDLLFTAGIGGNSAVTREGAEQSRVYMVGNILMDTLRFSHPHMQCPAIADALQLEDGRYLLFTLNRKALLADEAHLATLISAIADGAGSFPVVAPLRKRAAEAVERILEQHPDARERFHIVEPQSYLDFGWLSAHALGVITDSGNVAEEATFNAVPCITLNDYTEHIETVKTGSNELVGEDPKRLADALQRLTSGQWKHSALPELWDGRTAERIVQTLAETISERRKAQQ